MISLTCTSHSFGYDCTKRTNLHVLDKDHVIFCAGNFVEILNLKVGEYYKVPMFFDHSEYQRLVSADHAYCHEEQISSFSLMVLIY